MDFNALHHQPLPLLIANVWDASSALAAEQAGYDALGTASAAIATMVGDEDGGGMSFDELFFIVSRIKAVTELPLSVDLEAGYGDTTDQMIDNIHQLARLGVVGVNIEDSRVINHERSLVDALHFADKLHELTQACPGMFFNVRTDTFLLGCENTLEETLYRGRLYAERGAHGFFVPCVTRSDDIAALAREIAVPLNVMCMPALPDFTTLASLGVKRISMGNFIHATLQTRLTDLLCKIQAHHSFSDVFGHENNR